jgi:hypothetical protein
LRQAEPSSNAARAHTAQSASSITVRGGGQHFLGGRVDAVERLARRRVHPLSIDQHLAVQRAHDLLDARLIKRQSSSTS